MAREESTAVIMQQLKGIDFPAGKDALIEQAKRNQAAGETLAALEELPEKEYTSMADVVEEVGRLH